ncbi:MAG: exo-alpha-sialidase [Verrucomicrobia bacterium]|nr:exo-alpha-sialidase [Verrucomicrobiota bacterium]
MKKILSLFVFFLSGVYALHPAIVLEEFVFTKPPFASCHASTLTEAQKGEILCSWFAGTEEGADDVKIWMAKKSKKEWSLPSIVAEEARPCWNPVLYTMPSGEILLFYKAGGHPQIWSGFIKRSLDGGHTWLSGPDLPAGVIGPAKNRPLLLDDGTLLCGSSTESWKRWGCWIDITSDRGNTWQKSSPINVDDQLFGIIQPALVFFKDKIKLFARSHQIGYICTAESNDAGLTWSSATPTDLPNPNSSVDAINLSDGRILLVYNHSKENRYPLNVALSCDGGKSWDMKVVLESEPGEFSYPCVIETKDKLVHISYTWNRTNIKHVVLDIAKLQ